MPRQPDLEVFKIKLRYLLLYFAIFTFERVFTYSATLGLGVKLVRSTVSLLPSDFCKEN